MKLKPLSVLLTVVFLFPISISMGKSSKTITYRMLIEMQAIQLDSLQLLLDEAFAINEQLDEKVVAQESRISDLTSQINKLDKEKNDLTTQADGFYSDNLHLNQSNRILIAFNFLVGVLLLITLIFFLRRIGKNKQIENIESSNNEFKPSVVKNFNNVHTSFEDKLDQLEKLGKLKEKGVLTDDEFNVQKRSLLD